MLLIEFESDTREQILILLTILPDGLTVDIVWLTTCFFSKSLFNLIFFGTNSVNLIGSSLEGLLSFSLLVSNIEMSFLSLFHLVILLDFGLLINNFFNLSVCETVLGILFLLSEILGFLLLIFISWSLQSIN